MLAKPIEAHTKKKEEIRRRSNRWIHLFEWKGATVHLKATIFNEQWMPKLFELTKPPIELHMVQYLHCDSDGYIEDVKNQKSS